MEKLKQKTADQYRIVKAVLSMSNGQSVRWVAEDLWWKGLLEKVCLEFRVEEWERWMTRVVVTEQVYA